MLKVGLVIFIALLAITATSCSFEANRSGVDSSSEAQLDMSESIAEKFIRGGLPRDAIAVTMEPSAPDQTSTLPMAGWLDGGSKFGIVLEGSSSCPSYPSSLEVVNEHHLRIEITESSRTHCSADLAPITYVLSTPAAIESSTEVLLSYSSGTTLVLPSLP